MESKRQTADALLSIQQELVVREPIFHREEFGRTRADFEAMMAEEFWEVGASGRIYGREEILAILEKRYSGQYKDEWQAEDFYCQEIAPANYLLTYTLKQGPRVTRRVTIWRKAPHGWVIAFHQGTLVGSP